MIGWTDAEFADRRLMAPCGLYCGTCGVYIATRDGNLKFREILARLYGSRPEETACRGCMQEEPAACIYGYCRRCKVRECVRRRGLYSCHSCPEHPCLRLRLFPLSTGRRVIRRALPRWRALVAELGDEVGSVAWARGECERYHCPSCGEPLFRGAIRCRRCGLEAADRLDGRIRWIDGVAMTLWRAFDEVQRWVKDRSTSSQR